MHQGPAPHLLALVCIGQVELGQDAAGHQQTRAVGSGVVGQADLRGWGVCVCVCAHVCVFVCLCVCVCVTLYSLGNAHSVLPCMATHGDAVLLQLVGVGSGHDHIALDGGVHDLAGDVPVGEAHHQAVLVGVVLVLVLADQAEAGPVVRLTLTATAVLDLCSRRRMDGAREGREDCEFRGETTRERTAPGLVCECVFCLWTCAF